MRFSHRVVAHLQINARGIVRLAHHLHDLGDGDGPIRSDDAVGVHLPVQQPARGKVDEQAMGGGRGMRITGMRGRPGGCAHVSGVSSNHRICHGLAKASETLLLGARFFMNPL